jgi:hypothetical protein
VFCINIERERDRVITTCAFLLVAPTITKVRGCIDQYYATSNLENPVAHTQPVVTKTNGVHPVFSTVFRAMTLPYATTYNCMAGDTVIIQGRHFGDASLVRINGQPCVGPLIYFPTLANDTDVEEVIQCVLPASDTPGLATVTVQNEQYRGLVFHAPLLSYAGISIHFRWYFVLFGRMPMLYY